MKKIALKKQTLIAIITVVVVTCVFGVMLGILLKSNAYNRDAYQQEKLRFLINGDLIGEHDFNYLAQIADVVEFEANYKRSGMDAVQKTYSGILLKDIFIALEVDLSQYSEVKLTAADGYPGIYSIEDVLEEDNVYISYKVEGEPFVKGINPTATIEDGGPYVAIRAKDAFSQFRVKMLVEIELS